jgi:hypothetical protein
METIENPAARNVGDLARAITEALKTMAGKSSEKLKKPEVVAAMIKVLHSIVATKEGPKTAEDMAQVSEAVSGSFYDDLDAIRAYVDDTANGLA